MDGILLMEEGCWPARNENGQKTSWFRGMRVF